MAKTSCRLCGLSAEMTHSLNDLQMLLLCGFVKGEVRLGMARLFHLFYNDETCVKNSSSQYSYHPLTLTSFLEGLA